MYKFTAALPIVITFTVLFVTTAAVISDVTIYESPDGLIMKSLLLTNSGSILAAGNSTLVQITNGILNTDGQPLHLDTRCMDVNCDVTVANSDVTMLTLVTFDHKQYVMYCGTTITQHCHVFNAENITEHHKLNYANFFANRFMHTNSAIFVQFQPNQYLFSALDVTSPGDTFAQKRISKSNNGDWNLYHSGMINDIEAKQGENFEFIYGFSDSEFAYFLRNNRSGTPKAYLSQLCKLNIDTYFEVEIECDDLSIAKMAYYYKSDTMDVLSVVFCGSTECGLCFFNLTKIQQHFAQAKQLCKNQSHGRSPGWINQTDSKTIMSCSGSGITDDIIKCDGRRSFIAIQIQGTETLYGTATWSSVMVVTSIAIEAGDRKARVYIGNNVGELYTVLISSDLTQAERLDDFNVHANGKAITSMALDTTGHHLYFTTGTKVAYIKRNDCSIHGNCQHCLGDIFDCHWIQNVTTGNGSCISGNNTDATIASGDTYTDRCPIVITKVSYLTGPTAGGTTMLVYTKQQYDNPVVIYVGSNCTCKSTHEYKHSDVRVSHSENGPYYTCRTCPSSPGHHEHHANVTMIIDCTESRLNSFHVPHCGTFTYEHPFVYKEPTVNKDEQTQIVPKFGHIKLTLTGTNLDIGRVTYIMVGVKTCRIIEKESDQITCSAPQQTVIGYLSVKVKIDDAILIGSNVTYVDNPYIESITPNTSIKSGGIHLSFIGMNLAGLGQNVTLAVYEGDLQDSRLTIDYWSCTAVDKRVVCLTKPRHVVGTVNLILLPSNDYYKTPEVMTHFRQNISIDIVPDPVIKEKKQRIHITEDNQELLFEGYMLTNVLPREILIMVNTTACHVNKMDDVMITCSLNTTDIKNHEAIVSIKAMIGLNIEKHIGYVALASEQSRSLQTPENPSYAYAAVPVVIGCIAGFIVLMIILAFVYTKRNKKHSRGRYSVSYRNGDIVTLDGLSASHNTDTDQNTRNIYQEQTFAKASAAEGASSGETTPLLLDETTQILLERQNLLIDRNNLVMAEVIGQGHFGCVYKCFYRLPNEKEETLVAAKTLHRENPVEMDVKMFLKEALIMKDFHHHHVMELVGICLGMGQLPLVILPYMKSGDLVTYLRDVNNSPRVSDLVKFGIDIANGMHYLAELKFVHRDLAARNCMLSDDLTVKIADFGLSRDVYEKEYYSSHDRSAKLPIKWMSPESLEFRVFSSKSDVWSYGVVLWELLTRGMIPYPTVDNWEVIKYLKEGRRMDKPVHCPKKVYKIMQRCWSWNPEDRPTFGELAEEVPKILNNQVITP